MGAFCALKENCLTLICRPYLFSSKIAKIWIAFWVLTFLWELPRLSFFLPWGLRSVHHCLCPSPCSRCGLPRCECWVRRPWSIFLLFIIVSVWVCGGNTWWESRRGPAGWGLGLEKLPLNCQCPLIYNNFIEIAAVIAANKNPLHSDQSLFCRANKKITSSFIIANGRAFFLDLAAFESLFADFMG